MLRGIYNVASAMEAASRNQEIAAENLTNAVTPGYRRQGTLFEVNADQGSDVLATSRISANGHNVHGYSNFESGPLQQTSNPLDLALVGNSNGFFVVAGPNGPLYTRNGGFERNANGELQTRGGYRLLGNGGSAIQIPQNAAQIAVSADGIVSADGAEVGRLQLAKFERPESMRRAGGTLFDADSPQTPAPGEVRIQQGYREGSNVQPVQEMVSMMLGMRHYQAAEKAISALSDAISQNTRPQAGQ